MTTTSDPSTSYGNTEQRPLLSAEQEHVIRMAEFDADERLSADGGDPTIGDICVETVRALIASGELVVRNKCKGCGNLWTPTFITKDCCPGCGQDH